MPGTLKKYVLTRTLTVTLSREQEILTPVFSIWKDTNQRYLREVKKGPSHLKAFLYYKTALQYMVFTSDNFQEVLNRATIEAL